MSNITALIGYSGFIGSNLAKQAAFDDLYNSKNIEDIKNKHYSLVISAGNPGTRWLANRDPSADRAAIERYATHVATISAERFILVSTIDVFKTPIGVTEDTAPDADSANPYGEHRRWLEKFVKDTFPQHLIVRLPIVYGQGFRKNIIFDLLHNHELTSINSRAKLQFYNVAMLTKDITQALQQKIKLLHIATEPIIVGELAGEVFGLQLPEAPTQGLVYDMHTKYAGSFGRSGNYLYSRREILDDLKNFREHYES